MHVTFYREQENKNHKMTHGTYQEHMEHYSEHKGDMPLPACLGAL